MCHNRDAPKTVVTPRRLHVEGHTARAKEPRLTRGLDERRHASITWSLGQENAECGSPPDCVEQPRPPPTSQLQPHLHALGPAFRFMDG